MLNIRTAQLRRYKLHPSQMDDFLSWWANRLLPVRRQFGFTVEFAYASPETNEFTWAVSANGDAEEFARKEAAYASSSERREAFDGVPDRVAEQHISFVAIVANVNST